MFQSTRPRGARHDTTYMALAWHLCFNPRAHAGRDTDKALLNMQNSSFNPRAHAGRDKLSTLFWLLNKVFQSTRPRGARHLARFVKSVGVLVSIHAPTRGATDRY